MNRKLVGILVCMLLIASISNVFGVKNQTQIHDVGIVSINSPVDDGPAQKFPVAVTIKNYGNFEECCFKTRVKIGEIVGTDWIEEYNNTVTEVVTLCCRCRHYSLCGKIPKDEKTHEWICFGCMTDEEFKNLKERTCSS